MAQDKINVSYVRPEVAAAIDDWNLISDCIAGERVVKAAGIKYLPAPNADDLSLENQARYAAYKQRAVFYNVTRRTHAGLTALAFIDEPTIALPTALDYMLTDCDGGGISLKQQMKDVLGTVAAKGRCGLLVDYPATNPISRADMRKQVSLGLRPIVRTYAPHDIINWRTTSVNARRVPSLVVLAETYEKTTSDGFGIEIGKQWRVLRLHKVENVGFIYTVQVYREGEEGINLASNHSVQVFNGSPMQQIPFIAIGSNNNEMDIDDAPMLDLANMNIHHYCNSADYEESVFICGQPTPVLTGMQKDWWHNELKKTIRFGSRSAVPLPVGASLTLAQAQPNGLVREAMQDKERQMVALGARLIQSREVQRTATEARIETASEMSVLGTCANNVAAAYVQALAWVGEFQGTNEPSVVEIHANAELERLTPAERDQLIKDFQVGTLSWSEVRAKLRADGVATLDDEVAKKEIDERKKVNTPQIAVVPQQQ